MALESKLLPLCNALLRRLAADIEWEVAEAGAAVMEKTGGSPLPESTIEAVKRNKVAIKGPITTPVGTGFRSVNVALRKSLDLYVNLRPVLSIPGRGRALRRCRPRYCSREF